MPAKGKSKGSPKSTDKKIIEAAVASRPAKEHLVDKGILKGDKVAAGIASATFELEKRKVEDSLRSHLATRVPKEDLLSQNILLVDPSSKSAPSGSIQQAQLELKKKQTADQLSKKLATRTSEDDLLDKNILKAPVAVANGLVAKQQELQKSQIGDAINQQAKKHVTQVSGGATAPLKKRDSESLMEPTAQVPAPSTKKNKSSHAL